MAGSIEILDTEFLKYADNNGTQRYVRAYTTGDTGTPGEIWIDSSTQNFYYVDGNGDVREITPLQTDSGGIEGEIFIDSVDDAFMWCPSDGTLKGAGGDTNSTSGFASFSAAVDQMSGGYHVDLNWDMFGSKDYLQQQFRVERKKSSESTWTQLIEHQIEEYTDQDTQTETTYDYRVQEVVTTTGGSTLTEYSPVKTVTTPGFEVTLDVTKVSTNTWECTANPANGEPFNDGTYAYTWSITLGNPDSINYDPNDDSKSMTLTATGGGSYTLQCEVQDSTNETVTASVVIDSDY